MADFSDSWGGIYIHVPFCVQKCFYCDFYSTEDIFFSDAYRDSLHQELEIRKDNALVFDTLYFGGGTPSVLKMDNIAAIMDKVLRCFSFASNVEITLEANPGTLQKSHLMSLRQMGVNRINLGIQSFQENNLRFLGRIHTAGEGARILDAARTAGFENLGLDLIYGLPGQTPKEWEIDLARAVNFHPAHISCYILTYAEGTGLEKQRKAGKVIPLNDESIADLFLLTVEFLEGSGYSQYEISNFAATREGNLPDRRSRHNLKYWTFAPYLGFGPSAHSFRDPVRSWNVADVGEYVRMLSNNRLPEDGKESLNTRQKIMEWIYVGLRMNRGVFFQDFQQRFSESFRSLAGDSLDLLAGEGLLQIREDGCALTRPGMLLHDRIVETLVDALPPDLSQAAEEGRLHPEPP